MKKRLLTLLLGMACLSQANASTSYMTIVFHDGTKQSLALSDAPKISFSDEFLNIDFSETSGKHQVAFKKTDVESYHFSDTQTGISSTATDAFDINVEGKLVYIKGHGVKIGIYDISGSQIHGATISTDGDTTTVDMSAVNDNVYILSINGKAIKITNK